MGLGPMPQTWHAMGSSTGLYFTSLAGAVAGLLAWGVTALLSAALLQPGGFPTSDFVATLALGICVGAVTVAYAESRVQTQGVGAGILLGIAIGGLAGAAAAGLEALVSRSLSDLFPALTTVLCWTVLGSLIGLSLGLRWIGSNRLRVAYGLVGGLLGGALSGLIFTTVGSHAPDIVQALAFTLVGATIALGIGLAPMPVYEGLLQFISSGDARAQSKLSRPPKGDWTLEQGQTYTIGSQETASSGRAGTNSIFIPDAAVAPRHAVVFGQHGRFYLARHPDVGGQAGVAHYVLRLRGRTLVKTGELRDADDILVGRTALKFAARDASSEN